MRRVGSGYVRGRLRFLLQLLCFTKENPHGGMTACDYTRNL